MKNEEIIEKSIEKAEKNGWTEYKSSRYSIDDLIKGMFDEPKEWPSVNDIIFSHDFAKAFFKDSSLPDSAGLELENWQHQLQVMVLKEDPIKYLEQFL